MRRHACFLRGEAVQAGAKRYVPFFSGAVDRFQDIVLRGVRQEIEHHGRLVVLVQRVERWPVLRVGPWSEREAPAASGIKKPCFSGMEEVRSSLPHRHSLSAPRNCSDSGMGRGTMRGHISRGARIQRPQLLFHESMSWHQERCDIPYADNVLLCLVVFTNEAEWVAIAFLKTPAEFGVSAEYFADRADAHSGSSVHASSRQHRARGVSLCLPQQGSRNP